MTLAFRWKKSGRRPDGKEVARVPFLGFEFINASLEPPARVEVERIRLLDDLLRQTLRASSRFEIVDIPPDTSSSKSSCVCIGANPVSMGPPGAQAMMDRPADSLTLPGGKGFGWGCPGASIILAPSASRRSWRPIPSRFRPPICGRHLAALLGVCIALPTHLRPRAKTVVVRKDVRWDATRTKVSSCRAFDCSFLQCAGDSRDLHRGGFSLLNNCSTRSIADARGSRKDPTMTYMRSA
jgi:hypothetical protein